MCPANVGIRRKTRCGDSCRGNGIIPSESCVGGDCTTGRRTLARGITFGSSTEVVPIAKLFPIRLFALLVASTFAADGGPTAALLPMRARGVDSVSTSALESALHERLVRVSGMRILTREYTRSRVSESCDGMECATRLGQGLGVERSVVVAAQPTYSGVRLDVKLVDVQTGLVLSQSHQSMDGPVATTAPQLAQRVVSDLVHGIQGTPARPVSGAPLKEAKSGSWAKVGWVAAGAAVVAGGVGAALLFVDMAKKEPRPDDPAPGPGPGPGPSDGTVTFTWE